ncbi:hypothetical protein JYU34_018933 [Plutella xylostella]|uniref:Uncharacterized protein n=1 Tax=Plutella xylostella TaxID=51655 RepID=A0ABQ7PYU6_PLUXY|nr:hypothetical protein JYU34_018933 [Plutella xylostella]
MKKAQNDIRERNHPAFSQHVLGRAASVGNRHLRARRSMTAFNVYGRNLGRPLVLLPVSRPAPPRRHAPAAPTNIPHKQLTINTFSEHGPLFLENYSIPRTPPTCQ